MPQSVPFQVFPPENRVIFSGENTLQIQLRAIFQRSHIKREITPASISSEQVLNF